MHEGTRAILETRYHVNWCVVKWDVRVCACVCVCVCVCGCACVCVCVQSSNGNGFVLMQQRICFTPRALGAQFGQDVPYVFAACRKHVIWLPSGCSMAFTHGQRRGTFLRFFSSRAGDEMRSVECHCLLLLL